MRLAVELYGTVIGTLDGDARTFDFTPSPEGIGEFGTNSVVLSVAIPLAQQLVRGQAKRRRNWFSELLPEGDQYTYMLQQGGLRAGDTLGFLARYGRDVAGAVQLWNLDDPTEPKTPALRPVTDTQIRELLEDPMTSPLANAPGVGKSSLGGVQPKIVLTRTSDGWAQALGGWPTTHIVKPQLADANATVIFDEEYGSRIARRLGLAAFRTWIDEFDGLAALVIERYDRDGTKRIHQEDFNQALGASKNEKYQEIGGGVSLRRIAETLSKHGPEEDLHRLAQMTVLAVGIGNLDMHAKNLGLLHPIDDTVRLAPAYDMVPQIHRANDGRLALAVNGKYRHAEITRADMQAEVASWGLRRAGGVVDETLERVMAIVIEEAPVDGSFPGLQEQTMKTVRNLLDDQPAGRSDAAQDGFGDRSPNRPDR